MDTVADLAFQGGDPLCLWDVPCSGLLSDPVGTLVNNQAGLDHLCTTVMDASRERWCLKRFCEGPFPLSILSSSFPMPVGTVSLMSLARHWAPPGSRPDFSVFALADALPFDGNERALLTLDTVVEGCRIEMFGLAENLEEPCFRLGDVKFRVSGSCPDSPDITRFLRAAKSWWALMAGKKLFYSPGRPRKLIPYDMAQAVYWTVLYGLEHAGENRKPSYKEVCDHLCAEGVSIGVTRFGELVREWKAQGFTWPPPAPEHDAPDTVFTGNTISGENGVF